MPTNTLELATAVTLVEPETALMAAAIEMALDTLVAEVVVACVDVSELASGADTAYPLMTKSLPVKVMGASVEPERFEVVYIADVAE